MAAPWVVRSTAGAGATRHDAWVAGARAPFGSWLLGPEGQSLRRLRVRLQLLLTFGITLTHAIGAGIVVVLSLFVVPQPGDSGDLFLALAIAVPVYVGVAILVGTFWGTRVAFRSLRWALRGDEPTAADRRRALRVPLKLVLVSGALWLGAVVLFTALSLWLAPSRALGTAPTVGIGGTVVCAVTYLMTEFFLRPVSARALAGSPDTRPRGLGVGGRMLTFWLLGTAAPLVGLGYAALLALVQEDVSADRMAVLALALSSVVLVFGLLVTLLNARSVVAPIDSVRAALSRVQDGDLEQRVPVYDATELGLLQAGFNHMSEGLAEREHLRDLFGRHVGVEVARAAAAGDVELGGESRRVTVLFVDLVGSTTMAAGRDPAEVVAMLNGFFDVVVDEVDRQGGLVNKFMGDAVLAIFGAPVDLPDHATRGLRAARAMADRLAAEQPDVAAGIGVFTGDTVAGNVGTRERFEYTVIGDAVNAAARLTELAKDVEGRVLTCAETVSEATGEEAARWRRHETTTLRGRTTQTELFVRG